MRDKTIETIRMNGGRLCLDAVNTAAWRGMDLAHDFIKSAADARSWAMRCGLSPPIESHPAAVDIAKFHALRRSIRGLFLVQDSAEKAASAATLDTILKASLQQLHLMPAADGLHFAPTAAADHGSWLLGPIALSAAALLMAPERGRVRACSGADCHWLFLDESRAGNRRWCSMASCGNRVKARTHYETHRLASRKQST